MADPKIKVEIDAEIKGLQSGVDQAEKELSQLGKAADSVSPKIDKATKAQSNYNAVGTDFARIIQDAPFGIIGVSNNITQLASSFENARSNGQSFNQILGSIFSAGNLVTLGISAITTALVLYEQGVFDSILGTERLSNNFSDLASSIKSATANVSVESIKINALRETIEDETKSRFDRNNAIDILIQKYPALFSNADREKLLNGQLSKSYELLSKSIIQRAEASIAEQEIPNLVKTKELVDSELKAKKEILNTEIQLLGTRNKLTPLSQTFSGSDFEQAQRRIKDLKDEVRNLEISSKGLQINIDGFTESIISYQDEFSKLLSPVKTDLKEIQKTLIDISKLPQIGLPGQNLEDLAKQLRARREELQTGGFVDPNNLQNAIANAPGISTTLPITGIATQFQTEADKIKITVEDLSEAFTGLGSLIGKAFKNPQLGTFLGQFATFAAKLIATNFKIAGSNAVAGATSAAVATGPAAPFTLAGFIAASLGLVASAFSAFGGGRGGSGSFSGASGVSQGMSFAGAGVGMQFDRSLQLAGEFRVKGQDLVYVFNEASSKNQRG
jgi:hypothetical protein